jgi:hypothetical protein
MHVWVFIPINLHTYIIYLWAHLKYWVDLILRFTKSVTKITSLSMETSSLTEIIINCKYNIYVKSKIWTWVGYFHH